MPEIKEAELVKVPSQLLRQKSKEVTMATFIQVEKPKEVWLEIRKLITNHYQEPHQGPFMKAYPELYHLYLRISAHKTELQLERG